MKRKVIAIAALMVPISAQGQQWETNKPFPSELGERVFLNTSSASTYGDVLDSVVGTWGILKGNTVTLTGLRPNSFESPGNATPVKVTVAKAEPVYSSIVDSSTTLNAALPVLGLTWSSNQKAQVTMTDAALFVSSRQPTASDWAAVPKPTSASRIIFIGAARLSIVQSSILTKKSGGLDAFISVLKIGGSNYQANSGTRSQFVVSISAESGFSEFGAPPLAAVVQAQVPGVGEAASQGPGVSGKVVALQPKPDLLEAAVATADEK